MLSLAACFLFFLILNLAFLKISVDFNVQRLPVQGPSAQSCKGSFSPLSDFPEGQRMDSLAGHIAGEAALRLTGHWLVESHIQEMKVRPLLGVLYQRGRFARACVGHQKKKNSARTLQELNKKMED